MTEDVDYIKKSGRFLLLESDSNRLRTLLLLLLTYHYRLMLTCP